MEDHTEDYIKEEEKDIVDNNIINSQTDPSGDSHAVAANTIAAAAAVSSNTLNVDDKVLAVKVEAPVVAATAAETPFTEPGKSVSWRGSKAFIVFVAFLGIFADMTVYSIFIPILPFIVADVGGDSVAVSVLLLVYGLGIIISSPFFGWLADKWKQKRLLMVSGLVFLASGLILMAFVKAYWVFVLVRFLQGISAGSIWSLGLALVADAYHHEVSGLGQAMGWVMAGYTLGTVIGPPVGGALYAWSYYAPFVFCLSLIVVDLIARLMVIEPDRDRSKTPVLTINHSEETIDLEGGSGSGSSNSNNGKTAAEVAIEQNEGGTTTTNTTRKPWGFKDVLTSRPLIRLLLLLVAAGIVLGGVEVTLPRWLADTYGLNTSQIGLVFFAIIGPNLIFGPVGGVIQDKYGMQPCGSIFYTGLALTNVLPGITIYNASGNPSLVWFCGSLVIVSTFFALGLSPMVAEIAECVPREAYSMAYSLFNMSWSTGIVIGPILGAVVYERFSWLGQNIFFTGCIILALPAMYKYKRQKPQVL